MHRRLIAATLTFAIGLGVAMAGPAVADGSGDAFTDADEIGAETSSAATTVGLVGDDGGRVLCRYRRLDESGNDRADQVAREGDWSEQPGPGPGAWYQRVCELDGVRVQNITIVWLPDPAVDPAALAHESTGPRSPRPRSA